MNILLMGSCPISLDIGQVCAVFGRVSKTKLNTSKMSPMSSDIGWLPIQ